MKLGRIAEGCPTKNATLGASSDSFSELGSTHCKVIWQMPNIKYVIFIKFHCV